jgi:hypothetical protein
MYFSDDLIEDLSGFAAEILQENDDLGEVCRECDAFVRRAKTAVRSGRA